MNTDVMIKDQDLWKLMKLGQIDQSRHHEHHKNTSNANSFSILSRNRFRPLNNPIVESTNNSFDKP